MVTIKSKISSKLEDYSNREEKWIFGGPDFEPSYAKLVKKGREIYQEYVAAQENKIKKVVTAVVGAPLLVAYELIMAAATPISIPYTIMEERAYQTNKKEIAIKLENLQSSQQYNDLNK